MGAAAIAVALWKNHLRYNPHNPDWFARDRFVLSAGHACLLQYTLLHLTGYEAWTLDQIQLYHANTATDSMAAGHPEIEFPGVEVTTGPLGQGIVSRQDTARRSMVLITYQTVQTSPTRLDWLSLVNSSQRPTTRTTSMSSDRGFGASLVMAVCKRVLDKKLFPSPDTLVWTI